LLAACASTTEASRNNAVEPPAAKVTPTPSPAATVTPVQGDEFANFAQWKEVDVFIDEMVAKHGFERRQLQATLNKTHYVDRAIQLMKPAPPGKPKNWAAYRARLR